MKMDLSYDRVSKAQKIELIVFRHFFESHVILEKFINI